MIQKTQTETVPVFNKLQKLTTRLLRMYRTGTFYHIPFHKRASLFKRYKRCLNKIINVDDPVSKALGLLAVSLLLSTGSEAQCNTFVDAGRSNPLKPQTLPFAINKPVFVDIDNDGDLDCYAVYPDSLHNVKFAFLKNTGSKKFPVFQLDSTGGFPDTTTIYLHDNVQGMVFSDLDGDGDYDCFIGNYSYYWPARGWAKYFENVGDKNNPSFILRSPQENPLGSFGGSYGFYFNLVDIDKDGDYDLFTFDLYYNNFYKNKGTRNNPDFVKTSHSGAFHNRKFAHTVFFDWDKDGLTDYIKMQWDNNDFYKNDGTLSKPHYTPDFAAGPVFPDGFKLYSLVDLNNDGFPEAFSSTGGYAVTSPVATISAVKQGNAVKLEAHPKGNYTYQWRRNRIRLAGETKDSLNIALSGNYTVEITGNCGTGISLPHRVTINNAMIASIPGEADLSATVNTAPALHLYPNPFKDECVLKFDKATGKAVIYVTDAQGRLVTSLNTGNNVARFGKSLKPGIYFVQVVQNREVIFRQKIIKQ